MHFSDSDNLYDNVPPIGDGFNVSSGSEVRQDRYCRPLPAKLTTTRLHETEGRHMIQASSTESKCQMEKRDMIQASSAESKCQMEKKDPVQFSNMCLLKTVAVFALVNILISAATIVYMASITWQNSLAITAIADFQKNVSTEATMRSYILSQEQKGEFEGMKLSILSQQAQLENVFGELRRVNISNAVFPLLLDMERVYNGFSKLQIKYGDQLNDILDMLCMKTPAQEFVRLVNRENATHYGRVEVFLQGNWITICDDHWDMHDANVVCRMLGFSRATSAQCCAYNGMGIGPVIFTGMDCKGTEATICNCYKYRWRPGNCHHGEDASVSCSP